MKLQGLAGVSAYFVYIKVVHALAFCNEFNAVHNNQLSLINALKTAQSLSDNEVFNLINELTTDKFKKVHYSMPEIITFFKAQSVENKKRLLLEALSRISLSDSETMRLLALHEDSNGINIGLHNINNLCVNEIIPNILQSLLTCSEINCDDALLSESDKVALSSGRVPVLNEVNDLLSVNPTLSVKEILPLSIKRAFKMFKCNKDDY